MTVREIGFLAGTDFPASAGTLRTVVDWALSLPGDPSRTRYAVTMRLTKALPNRVVVDVNSSAFFDLHAFARDGKCELQPCANTIPHETHNWRGVRKRGFDQTVLNGVLNVRWEQHSLNVVTITMQSDMMNNGKMYWVVADTLDVAHSFIEAVLMHDSSLDDDAILLYEGVHGFVYCTDLRDQIRKASFDNLILSPALREAIPADFIQFFDSQELYRAHGCAWKRGALLLGPPGNGKTHCLKALIQVLRKPTIYVRSLARGGGEPSTISLHTIFARARREAPCLIVLEDLDSMLTDENRFYLLQELDGLEANDGLCVLATTNHPERIDPAIIDRPSRFDRKYYFDLPGPSERVAYLTVWNKQNGALQLSEADIERVAETTEGFSYAYLKELLLSSLMQLVSKGTNGQPVGDMVLGMADMLRNQMASPDSAPWHNLTRADYEEEGESWVPA
ncbi:MAG: ATP-binding protein [Candidatus Sumerlaeaceae bacterium]|nr:ATP-binding protein [Candidatus Sumerlaeaceae bacterium]